MEGPLHPKRKAEAQVTRPLLYLQFIKKGRSRNRAWRLSSLPIRGLWPVNVSMIFGEVSTNPAGSVATLFEEVCSATKLLFDKGPKKMMYR